MVKYRILADARDTKRRLVLSSLAGREWFSSVKPNLTENYYTSEELLEKIKQLENQHTIPVVPEPPAAAIWEPVANFDFRGDQVATPRAFMGWA